MTKAFVLFKKNSTRKDADLGNVIYNLRVANELLKRELAEVRNIAEGVAMRVMPSSSSTQLTPLAHGDKQSLVNEVLGSLNLQEYALRSELYGLTPKSELST